MEILTPGCGSKTLDAIAKRVHWKLVILFKEQCSASMSPRNQPGGFGPWVACNQWHQFAAKRIRQIDPALLVVSQASNYRNPAGGWEKGLRRLLVQVAPPNTKKVVLGSPAISTAGGADCMSRHPNDIQACSGPPDPVIAGFNNDEQRAAIADGARYVSVIPWFCAKTCSDVIGHYATYRLWATTSRWATHSFSRACWRSLSIFRRRDVGPMIDPQSEMQASGGSRRVPCISWWWGVVT